MFVPIDCIYHFLKQYVDDDVVIYRFWPHGTKNIRNLQVLDDTGQRSWIDNKKIISMIMHDQEPLDFDLYDNLDFQSLREWFDISLGGYMKILDEYGLKNYYLEKASKFNLNLTQAQTINDNYLICHSELNSKEMEKYQHHGGIGVYWWSHAMIAKDWYRFAKLDQRLNFYPTEFNKDFNIYNRAWNGTREYRLKFSELVLNKGLENFSNIRFAPEDDGRFYKNHVFKNPQFSLTRNIDILPLSEHSATSSADYNCIDYQNCAIDVVLETLFDDTRWHLTEKSLRPIACGKPFIIASTPGCLGYLQRYGFKTFGNLIDESYDLISDPLARLNAITDLMKKISALPVSTKKSLFKDLHCVAEHNKKWFWSDEFSKNLVDEFSSNYRCAVNICRKNQHGYQWQETKRNLLKQNSLFKKEIVTSNRFRTRQDLVKIMLEIKSNRSTS